MCGAAGKKDAEMQGVGLSGGNSLRLGRAHRCVCVAAPNPHRRPGLGVTRRLRTGGGLAGWAGEDSKPREPSSVPGDRGRPRIVRGSCRRTPDGAESRLCGQCCSGRGDCPGPSTQPHAPAGNCLSRVCVHVRRCNALPPEKEAQLPRVSPNAAIFNLPRLGAKHVS